MSDWIKCSDQTPPLPNNISEKYLVLVQSKNGNRLICRFGQWTKKKERKVLSTESPNSVSRESKTCVWRVASFPHKSVIFWTYIPGVPYE